MRMTQFVGLSEKAEKFLEDKAVKVPANKCPHCGGITQYRIDRKEYDKTFGMFEEEIPLHEYELTNGEMWREVVQAAPWSSGPVIFLCLEDEMKTQHFKWPQKDIDNC